MRELAVMVKALKQEQGSPRGKARYGFGDPQPLATLSAAERSRATEHILQTRHGFGMRWGHRDEPSSPVQRDRSAAQQEESRARLGMLNDRDIMPRAQRAQLVANKQVERDRLGWLEERDAASHSARERIHSEKQESRARLGMHSARDRLTAPEVAAHFDSNDDARVKLGFASQFGSERKSLSSAELGQVRDTKVEERARLGMIDAPLTTDWATNRREARLRKDATDNADIARVRLYANEGRTFMPDPARLSVEDQTREGRNRLGFLEGRAFVDKTAPRDRLDDDTRMDVTGRIVEGRHRLGFLEGRTFLEDSSRASIEERSKEMYLRLGMINDDGPRRLRTSRSVRTPSTDEVRTAAELARSRDRNRFGMIQDRTRPTEAVRSVANDARMDDRSRSGMVWSGDSFGGKGRACTPRSRSAASCSMHFTNSVTPRLGTADGRFDASSRRMTRSQPSKHQGNPAHQCSIRPGCAPSSGVGGAFYGRRQRSADVVKL